MRTSNSKNLILDTAEKLFAQKGYDGASMRAIAEKAGVAQGLIHYHCKTKEQLFEMIIARRSSEINRDRYHLLKNAFEDAKDSLPSIEDVLYTFVRPALEKGRHSWRRYYAGILGSIAHTDNKRSRDLIHKYYDPIAKEYIKAFEKIMPGLGTADIYWGYFHSTSVAVYAMARTGRVKDLSDGNLDKDDMEEKIERMVKFISGGLRALN